MVELTDAFERGLGKLTAEELAEMTRQHDEFLTAFPRSIWESMTLQQYALGTEHARESYSYALEWGTPDLGSIRGGTSLKHVIFRRRKDGEWHYPVGYSDVDEAWTALRNDFRRLLEYGAEGRWADVSSLTALQGATVVTLKTLSLYFPTDVLPVHSQEHLKYFAGKLGLPVQSDVVLLNRSILEHLKGLPEISELSGQEMAALLYAWSPPPGQTATTRVKIAPGPNGDQWHDCLEHGYICVGWDDVGDLSLFETEEDFRAAFASAYPYNGNQSQVTRKAKELWTLTRLRPGDKVVANRGTSEILAVGTVKDPAYEWRPERDEYRHTVAVEWDISKARRLETPVRQWATTTVLAVSNALYASLLASEPGTVTGGGLTLESLQRPEYADWARILGRKKQVVFYGPPGTGKTYAARGFTRWWLAHELGYDPSEFASIEELDRDLGHPGSATRAWWINSRPATEAWAKLFGNGHATIPLSGSGDDLDIQSGDLVVCYDSDPTSRVVALARVVSRHPGATDTTGELRLLPLQRVENGATWKQLQSDALLSESAPVRAKTSGTVFSLTSEEAQRIAQLSGIERLPLGKQAAELASYLTFLTFHASYSYEEFVEGYRPVDDGTPGLSLRLRDGVMKRVASTAAADRPSPYVLLIDEINRANLPRVFGELLTVLESDKRGLPVTLPGSGQELTVPDNLFVVGTMNTADRSIRTLDAALRRRFAFIELMPQPELLNGAKVDDLELDTFLRELNRRITRTAGRERQIGHSFFLDGEEPIQDASTLADVLRLEIVPLLQETAYDDYGRLAEYLGKEVVDAAEQRLTDVVSDPQGLIAALAKEYKSGSDGAS
jgi:5-methylcytosine-specific restriction protein B